MATTEFPRRPTTSTHGAALNPTAVLTVVDWRDPIVENHPDSTPTASPDTLVWWTPILGPTATLMAHRFATLTAGGDRVSITMADLARTFGLGESNARLRAALGRLERFGVISVAGTQIAVRLWLPPLRPRQIEQLPGYLADAYQRLR